MQYQQGMMEMSTTAMPAPGGDASSEVAMEIAEPLPPIAIDEPGVLDDNTFVDSGDSLWVATGDDRESTFALDVDTGSFDVAQVFLANGYPSGTRFDPRRGVGQRLLVRRRSSDRCRPRRHGRVVVDRR